MFKCFRKSCAVETPPTQTAIGNPLAVVPFRPENVEQKTDEQGIVHLRSSVKPTGLTGKIVDWVGYDYTRKLVLDEFGSYYYSLVDGQSTLEAIIKKMAKKLGVKRDEAAKHVVVYTKQLMTKEMLALKVPESTLARRTHEQ